MASWGSDGVYSPLFCLDVKPDKSVGFVLTSAVVSVASVRHCATNVVIAGVDGIGYCRVVLAKEVVLFLSAKEFLPFLFLNVEYS
jgi:hypothetical protein